MKNSKYSSISSLIDSGNTVEDPLQKAEILNRNFAIKSTVHNSTDYVPHLEKKDDNNLFNEGFFPDIWKISHITPLFKQKRVKE